ncbi:carboxymuconolactone decarboxylase family protein [Quisquiliibacterium transsilvanicum]|uniref:Alkylhydroperoxidase family enzyme n=1 Tax=Quisquiliibacterium transsilvanicum TaxID=1549638 RepID=A0A7W8M9P8_9BURK|nr:carboxymuconolactone decarboxylase family protein [Quisquiliibacterium transsilvanicum]MBB5272560.1 alkylhydroperoxidase family enzyme [Quisquiliibacterium transsilvanicum]
MNAPRIPYLPANLAEPAALVSAIRARRGGALLELDRMLLHSPALASGWNAFLGEVRSGLALDPKLRELAMCVVAVLNGAEYEFVHHAPVYLAAGGTQAQLDAMRDPERASGNTALFDATERAALALTVEMTRSIRVEDGTFAAVRDQLGEQQTVELVGVIAAYNMVSRFLVALGVTPG